MKLTKLLSILFCGAFAATGFAQQQYPFNGLEMNLGNLSRLSNAETRSISPENFTGEKGKGGMAVPALPATRNENNASWAARDLGQTWKVNPTSRSIRTKHSPSQRSMDRVPFSTFG